MFKKANSCKLLSTPYQLPGVTVNIMESSQENELNDDLFDSVIMSEEQYVKNNDTVRLEIFLQNVKKRRENQLGLASDLYFNTSKTCDNINFLSLNLSDEDRMTFSHLNQLISGHSKLNNHQSKINKEISNLCDMCNIPEDLNHYLFECKLETD